MTSYISQWPKQHVISVTWSHILKYNAKYVKEKTVQQRISKSSNYTYTHLMASYPSTTWLSQYLKGITSLDLNEARDDGVLGCSGISWTKWQMQTLCTSFSTDNHINISSVNFLGRMLFLAPNQQCQSTDGKALLLEQMQHILTELFQTVNGSNCKFKIKRT